MQRELLNNSPSQIKRKRRDRLAARIITLGGWTVLLTLAVLIWHLLYVTSPLLLSPSAEPVKSWPLASDEEVLLMEDLRAERAILSQRDCQLTFYQTKPQEDQLLAHRTLPQPCKISSRALHFQGGRYLFQLHPDGQLRVERLSRVADQVQRIPEQSLYLPILRHSLGEPAWRVAISDHWLGAAVQVQSAWHIYWASRQQPTRIQTQTLSGQGELVLLPAMQSAAHFQGKELTLIGQGRADRLSLESEITRVIPFAGDKAFLLGFSNGRVEKWSGYNQDGRFVYRPVYSLTEPLWLQDLQMAQGKDLGLLLGKEGKLLMFLATTGEVLGTTRLPASARSPYLAGNRLYFRTLEGIEQWQIDNISSIVSFASLWRPVLYDGYPQADYVWQSTAAEDNSQAKYSLVPLVIGSLKAALVALLVAIPLAVGAAIYTAYFVPQRIRNWLKPGIEMLEAIPSVVIGFIAAIWLIPIVEDYLLALILFLLLLPPCLVGLAFLHQPLSRALSIKWQSGWELILLIPLLLTLAWLSFVLGGEFQQWIWPNGWYEGQDNYSSKNALVVALALGIAIVPSIYSLAEDAIYEVPAHLQQASFALGATRGQTLRRVVLVAAYPGIFSSIMLGLSRAFGETMIVLMVTGNSPVPEWDLFAGMRTLTANIAIELPESEVGSIHYRILFFTALLLFVFTFLINTLAELVRGRLRKHYKSV